MQSITLRALFGVVVGEGTRNKTREEKGMIMLEEIRRRTSAPARDLEPRGLVTELAEALENGEVGVRRQAATLLGILGSAGRAAAPALIRALKDEDRAVSRSADRALGRMGLAVDEGGPAFVGAF